MKNYILNLIGDSRENRTAMVATLAEEFTTYKRLFRLADKIKTSSVIEWHLKYADMTDTYNQEPDIKIEVIDFYEDAVVGSADGDVRQYNSQVNSEEILRDIFGLKELREGRDVKKYVRDRMKRFRGMTADDKLLSELLCTEGIDRYVRKIVLEIPMLKEVYLQTGKNIDLRLRDCEKALGTGCNPETGSLEEELGLDGINGILYFSSPKYNASCPEANVAVLREALEKVPVFLIHTGVEALDRIIIQDRERENRFLLPNKYVPDALKKLQKGCLGDLTNEKIAEMLASTYRFLEDELEAGDWDEQKKQFTFYDSFYDQLFYSVNERQFLLPPVDIGMVQKVNRTFGETDRYELYRWYVYYSVVQILEMLKM